MPDFILKHMFAYIISKELSKWTQIYVNLILFRCFAKNSNFQSKFATTNNNFEKNNYLDMHYCSTYMYINFQQTLVSRSVQTVHTNIFANNRNLHKFAITNSNSEKNDYLDMHHHITYMYINLFFLQMTQFLLAESLKNST